MFGRTRNQRYLLWISLGTFLMALAMAVLLVFELEQKKSIQESSTLRSDSITALVFQFEREFLRFRQALDMASDKSEEVDMNALSLRYDIFLSRVALLSGGPSAAILSDKPLFIEVMRTLTGLIAQTDVAMKKTDLTQTELQSLLAGYNELGPDIQKLSLVADSEIAKLLEQQSKTMLSQSDLAVALTIAQLILLLCAAIALAIRQKRQSAERAALEKLTEDLRHAEREALAANRELEDKVQERTKALSNTLENLKSAQSQLIQSEKMATLGQLVANVAHEINTPIGAVKSSGESISVAVGNVLGGFPAMLLSLEESTRSVFFDLIAETRKPSQSLSTREERQLNRALSAALSDAGIADPQTKADLLISLRVQNEPLRFEKILRSERSMEILGMANQISTIISGTENINLAVERVAKIIFALKSFSHTDHTGVMQPADIRSGIETVLTIYSNQIKQGVEVNRIYGEVPDVQCLADELNQVWTNLIHNALQAMNNSGQLSVTVAALDSGVSVSIADNGPGIPDDIKGRIFDPFFTTKPVGEGSGLGLDIVSKIVDKHHGRLDVQSEVGVGTTFTVWLPLSQSNGTVVGNEIG